MHIALWRTLQGFAVGAGLLLATLGGALAWSALASPYPLQFDHSGAFDGTLCTGEPERCVTTVSYEGAFFIASLLAAGALAVAGALLARSRWMAVAAGLAFVGWVPPHVAQWLSAFARSPGGLRSDYYAHGGLAFQTQAAFVVFTFLALLLGAAAWGARRRAAAPARA